MAWPRDPVFRSALTGGLARLDMARFTLRHPRLLDTLLANVLSALGQFELGRVEGGEEGAEGKEGQDESAGQSKAVSEGGSEQGGPGQGNEAAGRGSSSEAHRRAEEMVQEAEVELRSRGRTPQQANVLVEAAAANASLAAQLVEALAAEWEPLTEKLDLAAAVIPGFDLDDLDGADGGARFDVSRGVWHASGWRELASLRAKLAKLRSLRDLVRSLGRSSELKGRLARGPRLKAAVRASQRGALLSALVPHETRGLSRSGDLGRMLPSESALLAAAAVLHRPSLGRLFACRRVERTLLSYERSGWAEAAAWPPSAARCSAHSPLLSSEASSVLASAGGARRARRRTTSPLAAAAWSGDSPPPPKQHITIEP